MSGKEQVSRKNLLSGDIFLPGVSYDKNEISVMSRNGGDSILRLFRRIIFQ